MPLTWSCPTLLLVDNRGLAARHQRGMTPATRPFSERSFAGMRVDLLHDRCSLIRRLGIALTLPLRLLPKTITLPAAAAEPFSHAIEGGFVELQGTAEGFEQVLDLGTAST